MGYMEEIFERAERQFSSVNAQLAWLSSFERPERGANEYTMAGVAARDELLSYVKIKDDVRMATLNNIYDLEKDAREISFGNLRDDALGSVNEKIRQLEGDERERQREVEFEEEREAEKESRRFGARYALADEWRQATSDAEREAIEEELRELPYGGQVIGGLKRSRR
jgi:hypothetical protein